MLGALERCADLFLRFGGHRQAAGLTIEVARLPELRARLTEHADAVPEPEQLIPRLRIDGPLPLKGITSEVVTGVSTLDPSGPANPRPIFHASPVDLADGPRTVKDRHLSLAVRQQGRFFRAMAWRAAERATFLAEHLQRAEPRVLAGPESLPGETFVQLTVADIRDATD